MVLFLLSNPSENNWCKSDGCSILHFCFVWSSIVIRGPLVNIVRLSEWRSIHLKVPDDYRRLWNSALPKLCVWLENHTTSWCCNWNVVGLRQLGQVLCIHEARLSWLTLVSGGYSDWRMGNVCWLPNDMKERYETLDQWVRVITISLNSCPGPYDPSTTGWSDTNRCLSDLVTVTVPIEFFDCLYDFDATFSWLCLFFSGADDIVR